MSRTNRLKTSDAVVAYYHLISRTNDKRYLFRNETVKNELVSLLKRVAEFSGIKLKAYTIMDNHFHIVCRVDRTGAPATEEEIVRRLAVLKGEKFSTAASEHWRDLRLAGLDVIVEAELKRYRERMNDISEFLKTYKEMFNVWYKDYAQKRDPEHRRYSGSIWDGRFKSTMIEDGEYLKRCMAYVSMNPVRAGMVKQVKDYRWSYVESLQNAAFAGPVPEEVMGRRWRQISEGRVFGSFEFVMGKLFFFGAKLKARHVTAHAVGEIGYASHGWRED